MAQIWEACLQIMEDFPFQAVFILGNRQSFYLKLSEWQFSKRELVHSFFPTGRNTYSISKGMSICYQT